MGLLKHDSDAKLDRLAMHLNNTTRLLRSGASATTVRNELRTLQQALDDVIADGELPDDSWIQHLADLPVQREAS